MDLAIKSAWGWFLRWSGGSFGVWGAILAGDLRVPSAMGQARAGLPVGRGCLLRESRAGRGCWGASRVAEMEG